MVMKYLTPGPVELPPEVLAALSRQPQFHRTEEFKEVLRALIERLAALYDATPVVAPGTGTFAVDMMVYNYVNPGERVVVVVSGEFGERLAESLESRGAVVYKLEWSVGSVPPPDVVEDFARKLGQVSAIAVVHNETSTGTANRYIRKYQRVAEALGAVLLVDSVSGFPAEPLERGIDVVALASQKALMGPPGGAILYLNRKPRAEAPLPPSMRLSRFLESLEKFETPYTPPITVIYGLNASLDFILRTGLAQYQETHRMRAYYLYNNLKLRPVAEEEFRSSTVAAFYTEKPAEIVAALKKHGYVIASGMWKLRNRSIRVGVMGHITMDDLKRVVEVVNGLVA